MAVIFVIGGLARAAIRCDDPARATRCRAPVTVRKEFVQRRIVAAASVQKRADLGVKIEKGGGVVCSRKP
jgi:hypothetical protein